MLSDEEYPVVSRSHYFATFTQCAAGICQLNCLQRFSKRLKMLNWKKEVFIKDVLFILSTIL